MGSKKLVLVVHGIGEQKAGETIDHLIGTITNQNAAKVQRDVKWLPDHHDNSIARQVESFPCHTRRIKLDESEVVAAEVFWADLSKAVSSRFRTLIDLVKTVLGIGYVVRENGLEKRPDDDWVRKITFAFVEVMHGPILVSNIINALILLCLFGLNWLHDHGYASFRVEQSHIPIFLTTLFIVAAIAALFYFLQRRRTVGVLYRLFVRWFGIYALYIVLLVLIKEGLKAPQFIKINDLSQLESDFLWYALILAGTQFLFWMFAIASVFTVFIVQWFKDRSEHQNNLSAKSQPHPKETTLYPVAAAAMIILFYVVALTIWVAVLSFLSAQEPLSIINSERLELVHRLTLSAGTPAWISLAIMVCASILVFIRRSFWRVGFDLASNNNASQFSKLVAKIGKAIGGHSVPRMIVGKELRWGIFLGLLVWLVGTILMQINFESLVTANWLCNTSDQYLLNFTEKMICTGTSWSLKIAAVLIFLFLMFWPTLAVGLGVAKDIVGYFSLETLPNAKLLRSTKGAVPVRRARINGRLEQVFQQLWRAEKPDEVVIIGHSQGTVVAMESIRDGLFGELSEEQLKECHLITMGSPLYHIYHHYFPTRFSILDNEKVPIGKWKNIYRIDDFVGTYINDESCHWPENKKVDPGGHTGYWMDRQVHEILYEDVLREFKVDSNA
ncbi:MAG: hypothetical protein KTR16_03420 [Acidiferrobacterales bacterium]|nr:hypothetical protein [Acidiferrobacterales bacterium]